MINLIPELRCHVKRQLQLVHDIVIHLERRDKHSVRDPAPEQIGRQRNRPGVGAAEGNERQHVFVPKVDLVVHQAFRKHKDVAHFQHRSVELVGGVHQSHSQGAVQHVQNLCAARMRVGWVDSSRLVPEKRRGQSEPREHGCGVREDFDRVELGGWHHVGTVAQNRGGEVIAGDGGFVHALGDEEVGGELRVGGLHCRRGQREDCHSQQETERHGF